MSVAGITEAVPYLTFKLSGEVFAVEVTKVREILEYMHITTIPGTPGFMQGVINVRGSVVPVVDLGLKFEMGRTGQSARTCIIVFEVHLAGETVILGTLADSVREVVELRPDEIEPPPAIALHLRRDFIKGMGKADDGFIIILDIDRVFSPEGPGAAGPQDLSSVLEEAI
jgi:purine-binding chemotaxis protein CheW